MFFETVESTQIVKMYISLGVFIKFTSKVYLFCIGFSHNVQYTSVFIATYIRLKNVCGLFTCDAIYVCQLQSSSH